MAMQQSKVAGAAAFSLLLLGVLACLATQQRTARVSLSSPDEATTTNWWTRQLSNTAAQVFWPHHKLIPKHARESQGLVLLNPGELSGELKDPDDPWGYSHPRCRGLPTCSSSTSSPAVTRHQQEMKRFLSGMKGEAAIKTRKQSLMPLNPGELSGELKDPDDPWGYSHPRCRGLPTCSSSTSSPAITVRTRSQKAARRIIVKEPSSLNAILLHEHEALANMEHVRNHAPLQSLLPLNPGELSGESKDPDDPWGYAHPRCRGLPTCSSSTSSPAIKRHQRSVLNAARGQQRHDGRSPDGHYSKPLGRSNPPGVGHPLGAKGKQLSLALRHDKSVRPASRPSARHAASKPVN
mmetsp:Transcript_104788/g.168696  ORF Transcript_104788/g.168696 Transcript_104788/m.168696 type:complete len:351 (-) Transcript_104788:138-1190(-)